MQYLVILIVAVCSASAKKEDFAGLEDLMNNPNLLSELEKRLGALLDEDGPDSVLEKEPEAELPCNATTGKLNSGQSGCDFHTGEERIIKTTDSLNRGAIFVGKTENILCAKDCIAQCCNNSECDTAVYQDKDEHKCYLFRCGIPSTCVFDTHSNYRVSSVSREVHGSHSYVPVGAPVSHENELEKLGTQGREPEPVVTKAPTTTEEPLVTTTRKPALGELCNYYGAKCADPHAECYMRECSCRAGYHQKYGVCRKHCREEEFECDNEGYGPDARQCIHRSYRCDGNQDCVDGSDEYGCPKVDTNNHPGHMASSQDTDYKPKETSESLDHVDQTPDVVQPPKQTQNVDNDKTASDTREDLPLKAQSPDSDQHVPDSVPDTATSSVTTTLPPSKDSQEDGETGNQSSDDVPKNSNSSDSEESESENDDKDFTYFSSENSEKVESYTDSSQGPIVALALGLAITLILLIFVGCRLRNVKRRLRKGRALHSNEADYLINGMYL